MERRHIALSDPSTTKADVHSKKAPDVSDVLPAIRSRGMPQPLLVPPLGSAFEIVA
ncbi:hypothetical protein PMN64_17705 [Bradyrhizobium sp. UFLA01-814]|uniref:hypothetical protein n=1 Tax=Bradyrhizobium sp. UFLA01-814 TaxID=3023480 RepID=UPI00398AB762